MDVQAPETPGRFSLRLGVYPPAQVLQTDGCLCHRTPASHVVEGVTNSRVPSLHGHYPASPLLRTPPPPSASSVDFPGSPVIRPTLLPPISRRDAEGFSSCLACPCPHAVAPTPPEWSAASASLRRPMLPSPFTVAGSASGAAHFRGHLCVRLRYGLETRPHPADEAVERLQKVGFPSPCSPSYRALAFPLVGFPPTEHASLRWTHNRT